MAPAHEPRRETCWNFICDRRGGSPERDRVWSGRTSTGSPQRCGSSATAGWSVSGASPTPCISACGRLRRAWLSARWTRERCRRSWRICHGVGAPGTAPVSMVSRGRAPRSSCATCVLGESFRCPRRPWRHRRWSLGSASGCGRSAAARRRPCASIKPLPSRFWIVSATTPRAMRRVRCGRRCMR
jgi:hypothetical protein